MAINPLLFEYKGNRCAHCGLTVEDMMERYGVVHRVFQFNHIDPAQKHVQYDNLIRRKLSPEQLNEVDKCVLLCDRCHDVLHAQHGTVTFTAKLKLGERIVEQKMKGQVIFDLKDNKLTVIADSQMMLMGYYVRRGEGDIEVITALELNDGLLVDYMLETRESGKFRVWDRERTLVFAATKMNEEECEVEFLPSFTAFTSLTVEEVDEKGQLVFSVRRGVVVNNPKHFPEREAISDVASIGVVFSYDGLRQTVEELKAKKG